MEYHLFFSGKVACSPLLPLGDQPLVEKAQRYKLKPVPAYVLSCSGDDGKTYDSFISASMVTTHLNMYI